MLADELNINANVRPQTLCAILIRSPTRIPHKQALRANVMTSARGVLTTDKAIIIFEAADGCR
jgi:hypothetical protein